MPETAHSSKKEMAREDKVSANNVLVKYESEQYDGSFGTKFFMYK